MIATEKEAEKNLMFCHTCGKSIKAGENYEAITTHSKKKIVVHTDCITNNKPKMFNSIMQGLNEAVEDINNNTKL